MVHSETKDLTKEKHTLNTLEQETGRTKEVEIELTTQECYLGEIHKECGKRY